MAERCSECGRVRHGFVAIARVFFWGAVLWVVGAVLVDMVW